MLKDLPSQIRVISTEFPDFFSVNINLQIIWVFLVHYAFLSLVDRPQVIKIAK